MNLHFNFEEKFANKFAMAEMLDDMKHVFFATGIL